MDNVRLLNIGIQMAAVALIVGGLVLLLFGRADSLGNSFRTTIEPILAWVRSHTSLSRSELADRTIMVAAGLAAVGALFDRQPMALLIAIGLWWYRPSIRRLTSEENPMLAQIGMFSVDLIIGLYVPIVMAQFIVLHLFLGASLLAVIVALSWPAGGGALPGRRWKLAPVTNT